jgi:hypothetical protein
MFVLTGTHPFVATWCGSKDVRQLEAEWHWTFPSLPRKLTLLKNRHSIEELMKMTGSTISMHALDL